MQTSCLSRVQAAGRPSAHLTLTGRRPSPLTPQPAAPGHQQRRAGRGRRPGAAWVAATAAPEAPSKQEGAPSGGQRHHPAAPDDIVVVGAVRTANCRARKGGFKDTYPDQLTSAVLAELLKRTGVPAEEVGDVCFGSVFPSSSKRANELRASTLASGFPEHVPAYTVNRQCAAGLQSIANAAAGIRAGFYDVAIAGGIESYTTDPLDWQGSDNPKVEAVEHARDVRMPLGLTAENVAERFGVPREEQDRWAARSHQKAADATAAGRFKQEIVPVETVQKDASGEEVRVVVDADDSFRADCSPESLAKLRPYFKAGGTVTVGNACSNTDCAAAVMLMSRGEAERRGLPVMATLRSFAVGAVDPAIMGTAPLVAVPKALERAGLTKEDIEIFELNEAFASQFAYLMREMGIPEEKVNPNGGAIALGHPAGATGARQTVTLLHELQRRNGSSGHEGPHYGLVSMCAGSGIGAAAVFEAPNGSSS